MRTITLEDLHIFQTVARQGGVLKAAEVLNRVPSNISTRIKRFEERLGQSLFRRQGRGVILTDAGHRLLAHADKLLQMADVIEQDMSDGRMQGRLRIGALESAAAVRLPPVLAAFHARHQAIAVELRTGSTGVLLGMLERYEIEAAFVSEPFSPKGLSSRPVFAEQLVLITAQGIPPITTPAALEGQSVVAFPHGCSYRRCLVEWMASGDVSPERFLDLGSYHAIVACVSAGAGVALVPASVLEISGQGVNVQCHTLPDAVACNRTHLVWQGEPGRGLQALMAMLF